MNKLLVLILLISIMDVSSIIIHCQINLESVSLISIANSHLNYAKEKNKDVKLIEVKTFISDREIEIGSFKNLGSVFSSFITPKDDITYIAVEEWFDNPGKSFL